MMKLLMVLVVSLVLVTGGCTMTQTTRENVNHLALITDLQTRMAVEDFETWWLSDRESRLTPWHARAGIPVTP